MSNLTEKELDVLKSIDNNEFGDNIMDPVYTWSVSDYFNGEKTSFPGVVSSLVKKGLVWSDDGNGDEDCMGMTDEGFVAYIAEVGRANIGKWLDDSDLSH